MTKKTVRQMDSMYSEAMEMLEKQIIIRRELTRADIRRILRDRFEKAQVYSLMSRVWSGLLANPEYVLSKGHNKKTDKVILVEEGQEVVVSHGEFLCPRCGKTHGMKFKKLRASKDRSTYWDMCSKTRQPILMKVM